MNWYRAGDSYYCIFTTRRFDTGNITSADSLPTAFANKNGVDDTTNFLLTVTLLSAGRYLISGTIPASGYNANDRVQVWANSTVNSVSDSEKVDEFIVQMAGAAIGIPQSGDVYNALSALITSIVTGVWSAASRTLSAFGFTVNINAPLDMALNSTVAKDAMVMKAANYTVPPTPDTIAIAVEQHIINESDGEQVLKAITDKIAAVDPDLSGLTLSAIASAVRTALATELGRIDATISSRLAASGINITNGKVDINDKSGFALISDYDPAKSAAAPGAKMDLINAPNPNAIAVIQYGLAQDSTVAKPGAKMDLINTPNPSAIAIIQYGLALDSSVAKAGMKMDLIDALNPNAIAAIQKDLARTGDIVYPVMQGRVYSATPIQNQEVITIQGNTLRMPFDFGGNYTGWTATFGAKVHLDDTDYIIDPIEATWLDASKGQGYIDLTAANTATTGKYFAEILLQKDSARLTAMRFYLKIINAIITT